MVKASVSLVDENFPAVGRDRIRLLEAVAREGSISAGARAAGMSYKGAWDALAGMANLFGAQLLETQTGGRAGGGARLTSAGHAVVAAFNRLEGELARALKAVEPELAGSGLAATSLLGGFLMRTSARNVLRGEVTRIACDGLGAEVDIRISSDSTVLARITRGSLEDLGLSVGRDALALVKANFIDLANGDAGRDFGLHNRLAGAVRRCDVEGAAAHVAIDIGGGRTLTASVTADVVAALTLMEGSPVQALFDPAHVIVAVD